MAGLVILEPVDLAGVVPRPARRPRPPRTPIFHRDINLRGLGPDRLRELHDQARELLRRAVLTDAAMPRVGPHGYRSSLPEMSPQDRVEEFGRDAARALSFYMREMLAQRADRFRPTRTDIARCNDVLTWLAWLRMQGEEGKEGARIIRLNACTVPYVQIALKYSVDDRTVRRWHVKAVTRIAAKFPEQIEAMEATP